jgi:hypothetical protein
MARSPGNRGITEIKRSEFCSNDESRENIEKLMKSIQNMFLSGRLFLRALLCHWNSVYEINKLCGDNWNWVNKILYLTEIQAFCLAFCLWLVKWPD